MGCASAAPRLLLVPVVRQCLFVNVPLCSFDFTKRADKLDGCLLIKLQTVTMVTEYQQLGLVAHDFPNLYFGN